MKLPRDVSGEDLIRRLERLGYMVTRTKGSHVRMTTTRHDEHHVTVPLHQTLRIGLLAAIIADVAEHFSWTREQAVEEIFGM